MNPFPCVDNVVKISCDKYISILGRGVALNGRIKMVRETLQLSQRAFGEKLGVSRDVTSNMEYGRVQAKGIAHQTYL